MNKLIKIFIILFGLFFIILSILYFFNTKKNNYTNFKQRIGTIETDIQNLNAENVDKYISYPILDELSDIEKIKKIESKSIAQKSIIYVYLENKNFQETWNKIKIRIDNIKNKFPKESKITFDDDFDEIYPFFIGVSGINLNYENLHDIAVNIKEELKKIEDVKKIKIFGEQKETLYIYFKNSVILELKITPDELSNFIKNSNIINGMSFFKTGKNLLQINFENKIEDENSIKNTIIYLNERPMLFGEVFEVEKGIKKPILSKIFLNGRECILIGISPKEKSNIFGFKREIKKEIFKLKEKFKIANIEIINFENIYLKKTASDFIVKINFRDEINIEEKEKVVKTIETYLKERENIDSFISFIGTYVPKCNKFIVPKIDDITSGTIIVKLKNNNVFLKEIECLNSFLSKNLAKNTYLIQKMDSDISIAPFEIEIKSRSLEKVFKYSRIVYEILQSRKFEYIEKDSLNLIPYYSIHINENSSMQAGVNPLYVFEYLNTLYNGKILTNYYRNNTQIPVILKGEDIIDPKNISIFSKEKNSTIPIEQIGKINSKFIYSKINRKNNLYSVAIKGWTKDIKKINNTKSKIIFLLEKIENLNYSIHKKTIKKNSFYY